MEELIKLLGPLTIPFLAGVGVISLFAWRKRLLALIFSTPPIDHKKRRDDDLIERLLAQNDTQMNRFLEAYQSNTDTLSGALNALRALAAGQEVIEKSQQALSAYTQNGFSRVHDRLDMIVKGEIR